MEDRELPGERLSGWKASFLIVFLFFLKTADVMVEHNHSAVASD
jgi:hypothetical protein